MKSVLKLALVPGIIFGAANVAAQAPVETLGNGSQSERLAVLERIVDAQRKVQHRNQQQLDEMQQEVNDIRGAVEVHSYKLEQILQRQRELYLEIDKRIESVMTTAPQPGASPVTVSPVTPSNQVVLSGDENDAYDSAVNLILKEKQYEQAIPEFESFLQRFPNSSYVPNAHYWLGLLQFNKQEWNASETHFNQVVDSYPNSSKRADSLLKLGVISQKRSNLARAEQLFQQVISDYPDSSVRKLAETRLRNLRQSNQ